MARSSENEADPQFVPSLFLPKKKQEIVPLYLVDKTTAI
jgi:hypothetical protein